LTVPAKLGNDLKAISSADTGMIGSAVAVGTPDRQGEFPAARLGLDFGTAFFQVSGNNISASMDIGMYLLDSIHDGTVTNNSIAFVSSSGAYNAESAVGILIRGTQRLNVTDNFLAGGSGLASIGISIGTSYSLDVPMPSSGNTVEPNRFGLQWRVDYDPSNAP
jgi:hypothetical protein